MDRTSESSGGFQLPNPNFYLTERSDPLPIPHRGYMSKPTSNSSDHLNGNFNSSQSFSPRNNYPPPNVNNLYPPQYMQSPNSIQGPYVFPTSQGGSSTDTDQNRMDQKMLMYNMRSQSNFRMGMQPPQQQSQPTRTIPTNEEYRHPTMTGPPRRPLYPMNKETTVPFNRMPPTQSSMNVGTYPPHARNEPMENFRQYIPPSQYHSPQRQMSTPYNNLPLPPYQQQYNVNQFNSMRQPYNIHPPPRYTQSPSNNAYAYEQFKLKQANQTNVIRAKPTSKKKQPKKRKKRRSSDEYEDEEDEDDEDFYIDDDEEWTPNRKKKVNGDFEDDFLVDETDSMAQHRPRRKVKPLVYDDTEYQEETPYVANPTNNTTMYYGEESFDEDSAPERFLRSKNPVSYKEDHEGEYEQPEPPPKQEEDEGDSLDKILDNREVVDPNDPTKTIFEYKIKWRGRSYIHCTWNTYEELAAYKGIKKLDNYIKLIQKQKIWRETATPEEIERLDIDEELERDLCEEHLKVNRVIAHRPSNNPPGSTEYFCVWNRLPYSEATWESLADIQEYQFKIDEYFKREEEQKRYQRIYLGERNRPLYQENWSVTPEFLRGGQLRDYQLEGLKWLVYSWSQSINCILADEMGLGKTIQAISLLGYLQYRLSIPGPFLVVVPLSTIANWESEFAKWLPNMNTIVYQGDHKSRAVLRDYEFYFPDGVTTKFNALITTYEFILKDQQFLETIKWNFLVVDEAHRLKNVESALHSALNLFTTSSRLLITGTPLQNSLKELWSLLNFLEPHKFEDFAMFEHEHGSLQETEKIARIHRCLKPHLLRRYKKNVEKSLPAKNERILRVGMSPLQKKYYKWVLEKNYGELNKGVKGQDQSSLSNIVVELKKVCNHPFLFSNGEEQAYLNQIGNTALETMINSSGKLILLDKLLMRLKETGHRVLIFSQMVRMLNILSDYMRLKGFLFQRLDGSMSRDARQKAMESFNAEGSKDFCFLLSTRAGGLGINLSTADTVIIFDSDWNPQNDLQAESRAHRIGQKNVVNIYRLLTKGTVEETILERAKKKLVLDHLVIQRLNKPQNTARNKLFNKNDLADILKFGAEELFKQEESDASKSLSLETMDLDEILERAEPAMDSEFEGDEFLSSFKIANFETSGDEEEPGEEDESKKKDEDFWQRIIPDEIKTDASKDIPLYLPPRRKEAKSYVGMDKYDDEEVKKKRRRKVPEKPKRTGRTRKKDKVDYSEVYSNDDEEDDDEDEEEIMPRRRKSVVPITDIDDKEEEEEKDIEKEEEE